MGGGMHLNAIFREKKKLNIFSFPQIFPDLFNDQYTRGFKKQKIN